LINKTITWAARRFLLDFELLADGTAQVAIIRANGGGKTSMTLTLAKSGETRRCSALDVAATSREVAEPSGNGPETRANTDGCTACKAVKIGSIPVRASIKIKSLHPLSRVFCYMQFGNSGADVGSCHAGFAAKPLVSVTICRLCELEHAEEATAW